jgi:hypothetical protein
MIPPWRGSGSPMRGAKGEEKGELRNKGSRFGMAGTGDGWRREEGNLTEPSYLSHLAFRFLLRFWLE